jgi:glutathione S-transferase
MSAQWIDIETARSRPGLRLVLAKGFPSPWSVAARWMLDLKRVPYTLVERSDADRQRNALHGWTGQDSLPAAMLDDERPRTHWYSIALFADRLGPEPRLVPENAADRAEMVGLGNELLGELGLLWCARMLALTEARDQRPDDPALNAMLEKYGSDNAALAAAPERIRGILALFAARNRAQVARGEEYLVNGAPTALDFYWAAGSVLIAPRDEFGLVDRAAAFAAAAAAVAGEVDPELLALRDRMFARYYKLPLVLD